MGNTTNSAKLNDSRVSGAVNLLFSSGQEFTPPSDSSGTSSSFNLPSVFALTISLFKKGGTNRGMGEKLSAKPVPCMRGMSVPIATSRVGFEFGAKRAFSYESESGDEPFSLRLNLAFPCITYKTNKEILQYRYVENILFLDHFLFYGGQKISFLPSSPKWLKFMNCHERAVTSAIFYKALDVTKSLGQIILGFAFASGERGARKAI